MHQVLVAKHCKQSSQWIVCKSVVDLSLETNNGTKILKLSECLVKILKRSTGKIIDVVIDELDSEDLDKQEVDKVNSILKKPEFQISKIIIAFQTCQKKRRFEQGDRVQKETGVSYTDLKGFKLFRLEKSMRFTSNICATLRSCQGKIEEKPNTYFCKSTKPKATEETVEMQESFAHERYQEGEEVEAKADKQVDTRDTNIPLTDDSISNTTIVQKPEPTLRMDQPTMTIDASFRGSEANGSDTKIISHFEYIKAKGSGNNIQGDIPNLLRLNSNKDVKPLAYFIQENCNHNDEDKFMVICNTEEMVDLAKASLETCDLPFIKYTDDIDGDPPKSTSLKKEILTEWQQDKDVLLVDCRGCRGMECQEVEI